MSVKVRWAKKLAVLRKKMPKKGAVESFLWSIARVTHAPLFWRKCYGCLAGNLMKECYKSSQVQQDVLKVAPGYDVTKSRKKKSLCSPNEVFQE